MLNKELCCKVILNSISQWEMTADLKSEIEYNSEVNLWEKCEPQTTESGLICIMEVLHIHVPYGCWAGAAEKVPKP